MIKPLSHKLSLHIPIIPNPKQIEYLSTQFNVNIVVYNALLDKVLQDYYQTGSCSYDIKEWPDYIRSIFKGDPIYPDLVNLNNQITIGGTITELSEDLLTTITQKNIYSLKHKKFNTSMYQSIWLDTLTPLNEFKSDDFYIIIPIPGLGKTKTKDILNFKSDKNIKVFGIQICANFFKNIFYLILHYYHDDPKLLESLRIHK